MSEERQREIDLRQRRSRGREVFSGWIARMNEACGITISAGQFLTIEATDQMRTAFFARLKSRHVDTAWWEREQKDALTAYLERARNKVSSTSVILFSSVDKLIGAVRLPADAVLRNAFAVWSVVEEDLRIATDDLADGLCLEQNFYTPDGEYRRAGVYELSTWGKLVLNG